MAFVYQKKHFNLLAMIDDLLTTFQCRGWGTDLVPPHLSQIYSQHVDEATKRESLSALALAITPR